MNKYANAISVTEVAARMGNVDDAVDQQRYMFNNDSDRLELEECPDYNKPVGKRVNLELDKEGLENLLRMISSNPGLPSYHELHAQVSEKLEEFAPTTQKMRKVCHNFATYQDFITEQSQIRPPHLLTPMIEFGFDHDKYIIPLHNVDMFDLTLEYFKDLFRLAEDNAW